MNDPFAKVAIGDPVKFPAQTWNAMVDAAKAHLQRRGKFTHDPLTTSRSSTIIRIKNETGTNLKRGSVLGLDGPIFTPADTNLDAFWREVCFRGIAPSDAQHKRRYAVTLQASWGDAGAGYSGGYDSGGQIVMACIAGVCPVQIDVIDIDHEYANIVDGDHTRLKSSRFGHARILWREGEGPYGIEPGSGYGYDTGLQWAIIMLGVTGSCFSVGKANGNISARVGNVYGTGEVDLYRSSTGGYSSADEDGPLETIHVLNATADVGSSLGAIQSGKYCGVAWDADDVAWVSPLECPS